MAVAIAEVLVKLMREVEPAFRLGALAGVEQFVNCCDPCTMGPGNSGSEDLRRPYTIAERCPNGTRQSGRDSLPSNTNPPML